MTGRRAALVVAALLAAGTSGAEADDMSLVLDRRSGAVEFYLAGPAPRVLDLLDRGRSPGMAGIDPERWRVTGSFDFGDALIAGTEAHLGGVPIRFEAMSAMLHPESDALPLRTPLDGMIAIAVCTAADAASAVSLDESRLYLGYIAYADDTGGEIVLAFAAPLGEALSITVRDHAEGAFRAGYRLDLPQGSTRLALRALPEGPPFPAWLALAALLINAVFIGGAILGSRRGGAAPAPRGAVSGA
jgi:hypothetical protein